MLDMSVTYILKSLVENFISFSDQASGETIVRPQPDIFPIAEDNAAELSQWFTRPLRTRVFTWSENTSFTAHFNPWLDYFTTPSVFSKLSGYSRMRCKLHVKIMINASPFTYSMILASYKPLSGYDGTVQRAPYSGGYCDQPLGSLPSLMASSQRMHDFIVPQESKGVEFILPFIYPNPWLRLVGTINDQIPLKCMGSIKLESMDILRNCSGTPLASPINISVYVWAEDIELSGPSTLLQSDEYSDSPVSTTASAVAAAAGSLSRIPIIGPAMRATQMVATVVGNVARIFGFSNPPVVDAVRAMFIKPMAYLSNNTTIPIQIEKIALDHKNELSISQVTGGINDNMCFQEFMKGDIIIGACPWASTDGYDSPLCAFNVTPVNFINSTISYNTTLTNTYNAVKMQYTPGCLLSTLFEYWRGPITYTFTALATGYHKGRIRIVYDPSGPSVNAYTSTFVHQHVWDLSESHEFKLTVDYAAPSHWLECDGLPLTTSGGVNNFVSGSILSPNYAVGYHNGCVQLSVLNELTAPAGSTIMIYVSCDTSKIEFASPREPMRGVMSYALNTPTLMQSDESVTINPSATRYDYDYTIGEVVKSIRTLIKRPCLWDTINPSPVPGVRGTNYTLAAFPTGYVTTSSPENYIARWILPRIPIPRTIGRPPALTTSCISPDNVYPWTVYVDDSTKAAVAYGCNAHTSLVTLFGACYVGQRGSIVWRLFSSIIASANNYCFSSTSIFPEKAHWGTLRPMDTTVAIPGLAAQNTLGMSAGYIYNMYNMANAADYTTYGLNAAMKNTVVRKNNGFFGAVKNLCNFQPQTEAIMPMYSAVSFLPGNPFSYQSEVCGPLINSDFALAYGLLGTSSDTIGIDMEFNRGNSSVPTASVLQNTSHGQTEAYVAAGDDYAYESFVSIPTLYKTLQWSGTSVGTVYPISYSVDLQ
jgi:hypothetical protein